MNLREELKSAGTYPSGPVSAWPKNRNEALAARFSPKGEVKETKGQPLTAGRLAKNFASTAGQALRHGRVSAEIRKARYDMCKACPAFNSKSKRCNDCGCFMEAKTWVGGNPDHLCPRAKWAK